MDKNFENLTIGKKDYLVEILELNQADLKFYTENPRVYSVLNMDGTEPTQDEIEEHMCSIEHVKTLRVSIESNGGLIDPLIVRDGDLTVLEGNSRLAAYRLLCKKDPIKWGKIKCKLLPKNIDDSAIFALLGQYHIIGRKDWDPFEQANYLYRRYLQTKLPIDYMAEELGITKQKAKGMIEVIKFMIQNDDLNKKHWSHYEEYLKNSGIKKFRETNPDIDETIVASIKSETVGESKDMRKLGEIAKLATGGDKQAKKLMQSVSQGTKSIDSAYSEAQDSGKLDDIIKRLKTFRQLINDSSFEKQIKASNEVYEKAIFEIKKIARRLNDIEQK